MYLNHEELLVLFLVSGLTLGYVVAKLIDWLWQYKQMRDSP